MAIVGYNDGGDAHTATVVLVGVVDGGLSHGHYMMILMVLPMARKLVSHT